MYSLPIKLYFASSLRDSLFIYINNKYGIVQLLIGLPNKTTSFIIL